MKSVKTYLDSLAALEQRGDAREESRYPALERLINDMAAALGREAQVTVLPKQTEMGSPDFRVWDGARRIIGYIEAKAPGSQLERVEGSEQLLRYLSAFPNVILTDFLEFRLYREGALVDSASLVHRETRRLESLFEAFFSFALRPTLTAEDLARELARRARFLRDDVIRPELAQGQGAVWKFYRAFQKHLIAGMTEEQFADLYAQTITYGLFAARMRAQGDFNRKLAYDLIPPTIGILRNVFQYISLGRPSRHMEAIVDDIAAALNAADTQAILEQYVSQGRGDDPIMHFYETFLAEYDPATREQRGVYYTPQPVVRYIVRAVHDLLKTEFSMPDGLADQRVTLLDPAAGTLAFPAEAIRVAFEEFTAKYGPGAAEGLVRGHILPHFCAFELLMAPYTIGHMKIGFLLDALGVPLTAEERFRLYLTNTLEIEDLEQIAIPGLDALSEESHHAARVKKHEPILVIMGNPPYSGASANQNAWTEKLLKTDIDGAQSYYMVDGRPLGEKNPKWLQDDYVKFLRFAQWRIHRAGRGIVAMITNHGYLDNPTFRGMRQSLLKTFDEIYLLDLHGNSLKRETAPGGGADENVFDIRLGVAIALMVKRGNSQRRGVYHAHLYGLRADKYAWLESHDLRTAGYRPVTPAAPFYFFTPRQTENLAAYQSWPSVDEIFPVNSVGVITARDNLTIGWTRDEAWTKVLKFSRLSEEAAREAFQLGQDARDWQVRLAQQDVKRDGGPRREKIVPILYRPFDVRYTYYTGRSRGFQCMPRPEVMSHMLAGENLALVTTRQVKASQTWQHCFVSSQILVCTNTREISYAFPLYLYPSASSPDMFHRARKPNLAEWLLPGLSAAYGFAPGPEDALAYIYAVLYSPAYRQKYAQELRTDFPRIPFTADGALFRRMADIGRQLIDLHLLRNPANTAGVRYQGRGSDAIEKARYDAASWRVHINADRFFEGVTPEMWEYRIGGYQPLEKYLKDRRGRRMDNPLRYIHIASAIAETIRMQGEIDALYSAVEAQTLGDMQDGVYT